MVLELFNVEDAVMAKAPSKGDVIEKAAARAATMNDCGIAAAVRKTAPHAFACRRIADPPARRGAGARDPRARTLR